jgi:hypothetical protein
LDPEQQHLRNATVTPGGTCTFDVAFHPLALGPLTGSITINSDAASTPDTVTLNGNGVDSIPPVLTVPANMTVNATSAAGAVVNFTASATDLVDASPTVACLPASGSTFPLGVNTVNCTATDDSSNVDSDSFTITVQNNPNEIILYYPTPDELLHFGRPTFDWSDYPGAVDYQIQISKNATFTKLFFSNFLGKATSYYTPVANLPANQTLFWRVRARTPSTPTTLSAWSETRSFHTANPPTVPALTAPANNALVPSTTPLLNWNNSALPRTTSFSRYQIQVSTSNTIGTTVIDTNTTVGDLADSDFTPASGILTNGVTYYWHVRSFNASGDYSAWSLTRSFRVVTLPPVLVSPLGGSMVGSLKPLFDWDLVPGATSYTIQVSLSSAFTSLRLNATVAAPNTAYTPLANLPAGTLLYWRVRANGPYGPSAWSTSGTFTTP